MKSTKEGYRFLFLALLHTTNHLKESERDTGRLWAAGHEGRQRIRQLERERKGKAGRQRVRAASKETRQEKKVVGSHLLLHDDLLSRRAVTDTQKQHLPQLDYMHSCNIWKAA